MKKLIGNIAGYSIIGILGFFGILGLFGQATTAQESPHPQWAVAVEDHIDQLEEKQTIHSQWFDVVCKKIAQIEHLGTNGIGNYSVRARKAERWLESLGLSQSQVCSIAENLAEGE